MSRSPDPRQDALIEARSWRIIILVICLIILAVVAAWLHRTEPELKTSEEVKIITGGLVIIALIYTVLSYESTQTKNVEDSRTAKALATYEIIKQWYTQPLTTYVKTSSEFEDKEDIQFKDIQKDGKKLYQIIYDNDDYWVSIISLFNYFESICTAYDEDILDKIYLRRYFETIIIGYGRDYAEFIKEKRIKEEDKLVWIEFTNLAKTWSQEIVVPRQLDTQGG